MRFISKTFLRGLVTVLPIALTVYVLWWIGSSCEHLAERVVRWLFPSMDFYVPGIGLVLGFAFIFVVGLFMRAWIARWLFSLGERWLQRIPFVKTVYGPLKDLAGFFGDGDKKQGFHDVVMVEVGGVQVMGFVTGERIGELAGGGKVSVYVPMSYQLGGFVLVVEPDRVRKLDISVENGLRLALTAGVGGE